MIRVSATFIRDPGLSPVAKIVALTIATYGDGCFPSHDRIGKDIGVHRNTVAGAVEELANCGKIRVLPKTSGRGNQYNLGPMADSIAQFFDNTIAQKNSIAQKLGTNSDHSDSDHDLIYYSSSLGEENEDQDNGGIETERPQGDDPHVNDEKPALDAPAPSPYASGYGPGSGAPSGGMGFVDRAKREAVRFGLQYHCPEDEDQARADIEEAVLLADGTALDLKKLDQLVNRYGVIKVWSQARYLSERIDRYKLHTGKPVPKPTGFFIRSVEADAGIQYGEPYSANQALISEWYRKLLFNGATVDDAPGHIRKWLANLMQAYHDTMADVPEIIAEPADDDIEF